MKPLQAHGQSEFKGLDTGSGEDYSAWCLREELSDPLTQLYRVIPLEVNGQKAQVTVSIVFDLTRGAHILGVDVLSSPN